jgi:hypothetical protein
MKLVSISSMVFGAVQGGGHQVNWKQGQLLG